jgi:hypothetical protein
MTGRVVIGLLVILVIFSLGYLTTDIIYKRAMADYTQK